MRCLSVSLRAVVVVFLLFANRLLTARMHLSRSVVIACYSPEQAWHVAQEIPV
jgi:hypothetical protein